MIRLLLKIVLFVCIVTHVRDVYAEIDWRSVDSLDLTETASSVEKGADAEALFWNIWFDDRSLRTSFTHYVRVKIFTARGVESQSRIDLSYFGQSKITDIAARTIKPDGSILELKKDAVFDRTLIKLGKAKVQAKSFVLPGVEPGAIVEYQWREELPRAGLYTRLEFQREIPVRSVKYYVRPSPFQPAVVQSFNMPNIPLIKEGEGYSSLALSNVPAFREEPQMPPQAQVRPWVLLYYGYAQSPSTYWTALGRAVFEANSKVLKVDADIRRATAVAIGETTTPEERLRRIFDYCRTNITNAYDDAAGYSLEYLLKLKENKSPSDTLKRKVGSDADIDALFATMAIAAGLDARLVLLPDRSDIFFEPGLVNQIFLTRWSVAVKVGAGWKFFNPSNRYATFGMLDWREEGQFALLPDAKEPVWITTPMSPPDRSLIKRFAKLKLADDGTLEGEVEIAFTGHFAADEKEFFDNLTAAEPAEQVTRDVQGRINVAEVSAVAMENVKDFDKPLTVRYHVRIPRYGERTGTRIFFRPGFFQSGEPLLFPESTRTHPIYFHFPWTEQDEVSIELPSGFDLETGESPGAARAANLATYDTTTQLVSRSDTQTVGYQRQLAFGLNGVIVFPAGSYSDIKTIFDAFHQRDEHTLSLKAVSPQH